MRDLEGKLYYKIVETTDVNNGFKTYEIFFSMIFLIERGDKMLGFEPKTLPERINTPNYYTSGPFAKTYEIKT